MMVRFGRDILGVLLAEQARGWLERAQQRAAFGYLGEVRILGDEDTRQYRAVRRDGDRDPGLARRNSGGSKPLQ
jgi:hypothetical protein